ncbi:Frag1/DRAM/Sfk1, partial [Leucosporidium creatinivorum]
WIIWPILATAAWFSTIFGMLMWWAVADKGRPYEGDQQTILYVSDVGAEHDDLFIAGSVLTAVFYAVSLVLGRWLRHLRRLPGVLRKRERVAAILSIVLGIIGGFWLIMLSVFNNRDHSTAHWTFAALFLAFIALSALAQVFEVHWLSRSHPDRKHLHRNSIIKMVVIGLAYIGAALFIICYIVGRGVWDSDNRPTGGASVIKSVAAVFEWTVAFVFDAYLATFVLDLWPAHKT